MSQMIPVRLILAALLALFPTYAGAQDKEARPAADVKAFVRALWPDAEARGISRKTFDAAVSSLTIDSRVAPATLRQPEFGRPVGAYVNGIATAQRISLASAKAAQWSDTLGAIEQQYGVDRWMLLAIWGIESSFGTNKGGFDVIRSLATLTLIGYRPDFFRDELLAALKVLDEGHVDRPKMVGSWAGAMGQPQFMPSNFLELAVDFDRNGRKDIWDSVPDVLASIANFLAHWRWKAGTGWGAEVLVPQGFDYRRSRASYAEWGALGVTRADGKPMPEGSAILFFPSGAAGPAFLVSENFEVIKRYNNSDVFALAVSHLADRARGLGRFRAAWPVPDRQLSRVERIALQKRMKVLGHPVNDFEGRIDFELRDEIRLEQAKHGMRPDGHPTPALLEKIGARN